MANSEKQAERRTLRFETIDQALAEAERLAAADREGRLSTAGTWTLGQALGHIATWAGFAFTGTPLNAPFFVRWPMRLMKNRMIHGAMRPGVRIPKVDGGTLGVEPLSLDEGLSRFRPAFGRLRDQAPTIRHMFFGQMTHAEWIGLNLRHAELHLGFFNARG